MNHTHFLQPSSNRRLFIYSNPLNLLVEARGIEPLTPSLQSLLSCRFFIQKITSFCVSGGVGSEMLLGDPTLFLYAEKLKSNDENIKNYNLLRLCVRTKIGGERLKGRVKGMIQLPTNSDTKTSKRSSIFTYLISATYKSFNSGFCNLLATFLRLKNG